MDSAMMVLVLMGAALVLCAFGIWIGLDLIADWFQTAGDICLASTCHLQCGAARDVHPAREQRARGAE